MKTEEKEKDPVAEDPATDAPGTEPEQTETAQSAQTAPEAEAETQEAAPEQESAKQTDTVPALKAANKKLTEQVAAGEDKYLRMIAEYDNYRKRAQKERESVYADAYTDVLKEILPIVDNLERAAQFTDNDQVSAGVQMTLKQCNDILKKLGVTEIGTEKFDPNLHNAVMHVEDEEHGEGEILEVFQKGYRKDDKILRYAMVKVAN